MRERLRDKRQRWKAERGHRETRHWADRAIWSQPDSITAPIGYSRSFSDDRPSYNLVFFITQQEPETWAEGDIWIKKP